MPDNALLLLAGIAAALALGLVLGIVFLVRFFRTRQKKWLWLGLLLTLGLPGLILLLLLALILWTPVKNVLPPTVTCYVMTVMAPPRQTEGLRRHKAALRAKFQDRVSAAVLEKTAPEA